MQIELQLKYSISFRKENMQLSYRNLISGKSGSFTGVMDIMVQPQTSNNCSRTSRSSKHIADLEGPGGKAQSHYKSSCL